MLKNLFILNDGYCFTQINCAQLATNEPLYIIFYFCVPTILLICLCSGIDVYTIQVSYLCSYCYNTQVIPLSLGFTGYLSFTETWSFNYSLDTSIYKYQYKSSCFSFIAIRFANTVREKVKVISVCIKYYCIYVPQKLTLCERNTRGQP